MCSNYVIGLSFFFCTYKHLFFIIFHHCAVTIMFDSKLKFLKKKYSYKLNNILLCKFMGFIFKELYFK